MIWKQVSYYIQMVALTVERTTEKILQYLHYMLPSNHHLQLCTLSRRHTWRDNNEKRNSLQQLAITETDSQNNYRQSSLIFLRRKLQ